MDLPLLFLHPPLLEYRAGGVSLACLHPLKHDSCPQSKEGCCHIINIEAKIKLALWSVSIYGMRRGVQSCYWPQAAKCLGLKLQRGHTVANIHT